MATGRAAPERETCGPSSLPGVVAANDMEPGDRIIESDVLDPRTLEPLLLGAGEAIRLCTTGAHPPEAALEGDLPGSAVRSGAGDERGAVA